MRFCFEWIRVSWGVSLRLIFVLCGRIFMRPWKNEEEAPQGKYCGTVIYCHTFRQSYIIAFHRAFAEETAFFEVQMSRCCERSFAPCNQHALNSSHDMVCLQTASLVHRRREGRKSNLRILSLMTNLPTRGRWCQQSPP